MSYKMPPEGHKARALMGDLAHVAEVLDPANIKKLESFPLARRAANKFFEENPAARAIVKIVMRCDDERWLVSYGPRGGWKKLWNFGKGY